MIDPGGAFRRLRCELSAEEQSGPIKALYELDLRKKRRDERERQLAAIEPEVRLLRRRLQLLPELPDMACVMWAQCVLACPNGRILIADTAFANEEACVIHVLLLDFQAVDTSYRLTSSAPPDCSAVDRARGQLHLLQSMARGITGTPCKAPVRAEPDEKRAEDGQSVS